MKITDNFLDVETFKNIQNELTQKGGWFDWYFNYVTKPDPTLSEFQFCHMFYNGTPTAKYNLIKPIIDKINPFALVRVKANLITRTHKIKEYTFHRDFEYNNLTTAIFYINTCNGYTSFENGKKVNSVENRLVEFDSNLKHTGSSCTNEMIRCVINMNYFK
tara:strand:- start:97 stop:579 length:483 start_codon:yes stop_codon:yes gene_type:complete